VRTSGIGAVQPNVSKGRRDPLNLQVPCSCDRVSLPAYRQEASSSPARALSELLVSQGLRAVSLGDHMMKVRLDGAPDVLRASCRDRPSSRHETAAPSLAASGVVIATCQASRTRSSKTGASPEGVRRRIRATGTDTRAAGEDRFRWTVAVLGQLGPITEGRAENRVEPARPAGGNVRLSER
jgi:hypothetical protein